MIIGSHSSDDREASIGKIISQELMDNGWNVETLPLHGKEIANCIGCFGCWIKTPGECVQKDDGQDVAREVINSEVMVLIGHVTFGGYSSELKKVVDRFIPLILPLFTKVQGEVHHKPRYDKYPIWVNIGILAKEDDECRDTFRKLLERNAINFFCPAHARGFIGPDDGEDEVRNKMRGILKEVGVGK